MFVIFSKINKKNFNVIIKTVIFVAVFIFSTNSVFSATLSVIPTRLVVNTGELVKITISVDTQNKIINNTEGTIDFSPDLLEIVSIDRSQSIFNLWINEPTYSNSKGTLLFNGGKTNPGYTGASGIIFSATVRAKKQGVASVALSQVSIRENDGLGTDITTGKNDGIITIKSETIPTIVDVPLVKSEVLALPIVSSKTHPDQLIWYNNTDAVIEWALPKGVKSVLFSLDREKDTEPKQSIGLVKKRIIKNINDGTKYVQVRFKGLDGVLSPTAHFIINIDTQSPDSIAIQSVDSVGNYRVYAHDEDSGVDRFEIVFPDGKSHSLVAKNNEAFFSMGDRDSGDYTITIKAYDSAQNSTEQSLMISYKKPVIEIPIQEKQIQQSENKNMFVFLDSVTPYLPWIITCIVLVLLLIQYIMFRTALRTKESYEKQEKNLEKSNILVSDTIRKHIILLEKIEQLRPLTLLEQKILGWCYNILKGK